MFLYLGYLPPPPLPSSSSFSYPFIELLSRAKNRSLSQIKYSDTSRLIEHKYIHPNPSKSLLCSLQVVMKTYPLPKIGPFKGQNLRKWHVFGNGHDLISILLGTQYSPRNQQPKTFPLPESQKMNPHGYSEVASDNHPSHRRPQFLSFHSGVAFISIQSAAPEILLKLGRMFIYFHTCSTIIIITSRNF